MAAANKYYCVDKEQFYLKITELKQQQCQFHHLIQWCDFTAEASYTMNITNHRAVQTSPYEAVFSFNAHREDKEHTDAKEPGLQADQEEKSDCQINDQWQAKRHNIVSNQSIYNKKMVQQTSK